MRRGDRRPYGDDVHFRVILRKDAAFQTRMDSDYIELGGKELPVSFLGNLLETAVFLII